MRSCDVGLRRDVEKGRSPLTNDEVQAVIARKLDELWAASPAAGPTGPMMEEVIRDIVEVVLKKCQEDGDFDVELPLGNFLCG